jgi:hypothetical protein
MPQPLYFREGGLGTHCRTPYQLDKEAKIKLCHTVNQTLNSSYTAYWQVTSNKQDTNPLFLYFVDCASRYKFLLMTNLTHFFMYLFISSLYKFRASQGSPSDQIVLIHHLVWLVCDCLVCRYDRHTKQSLTQTNHIRWFINTIWSPDDEHCDAWNM